MSACSVKKQSGVLDRLAEDRPAPPGRALLSFTGQSPSVVLELCPAFAVQRGQGVLAGLAMRTTRALSTSSSALQVGADCAEHQTSQHDECWK